ncbi:MAG: hypothetical protein JWL86_1972, partial [Rhizobium sp.]|nr:hypothetical protein [Rhizobium sp.]
HFRVGRIFGERDAARRNCRFDDIEIKKRRFAPHPCQARIAGKLRVKARGAASIMQFCTTGSFNTAGVDSIGKLVCAQMGDTASKARQ